MKHREEIMQILEAFDLTRSHRDAGELAGCSPNTVGHWVARRDAGELTATSARRPQLIDEFLPKVEEWMEASHGKVRADVAHDKLVAMGYAGSERTTRRAAAAARAAYGAGHRRVHRPWVPEPGLWFQWDFGDGPAVAGSEVGERVVRALAADRPHLGLGGGERLLPWPGVDVSTSSSLAWLVAGCESRGSRSPRRCGRSLSSPPTGASSSGEHHCHLSSQALGVRLGARHHHHEVVRVTHQAVGGSSAPRAGLPLRSSCHVALPGLGEVIVEDA